MGDAKDSKQRSLTYMTGQSGRGRFYKERTVLPRYALLREGEVGVQSGEVASDFRREHSSTKGEVLYKGNANHQFPTLTLNFLQKRSFQ